MKPQEDFLFDRYREAKAALIQKLVGDVVQETGPQPAPSPAPGPTPAPRVPAGFLVALTGCVGAFVVGQVATPLLLIWLVLHPGPSPAPNPTPPPAPAPAPAPAPGPAPQPPTPVAGRLDVILVYNERAADVGVWNAVKALKDDPATGPALKALDAHWECLPAGSEAIDKVGLRGRLPDPAQLPTLLIYDSANFYGIDGTVLGPGAVRVPPPPSVAALVSAVKQIRGVK